MYQPARPSVRISVTNRIVTARWPRAAITILPPDPRDAAISTGSHHLRPVPPATAPDDRSLKGAETRCPVAW
jgi:hypothetical protein